MPFRSFPRKTRPGENQPLFAAPAENGILAHIDGGARGNPGPAGFGVYIQDAKHAVIAEISEFLGHQTNNYAEYSALLAALEYAIDHAHPVLHVVSDSELLVKQIRGEYKVKSPELKHLYDRAQSLIPKLEHFEIRHVLRERNQNADRLANAAMDRGMGKSPAAAAPTASAEYVSGVVRDGVIETERPLPEGTRVKVKILR
jgi:probable phosphoglycerate mutase